MNYLVFLQAGELEKILSGIKTMLPKEFDPSQFGQQSVRPGDTLYFLRNPDEYALRVKASVVRVLPVLDDADEALSRTLKEMQPRLQLNEDQYHHWSSKAQLVLVEFNGAQKIDVIHIASDQITDRSDWIVFEAFSEII